ncbi:hypothetical protein B0O99DRAFT_520500 [Bisporella sp. PMI_857]|nr:hypothetical protein B0O99DRAFT_520500 [Bisporella sp. PMI_857]
MSNSRPVTPGSPKVHQIKPPQPGVPRYGCLHLQKVLNHSSPQTVQNTIEHYRQCLKVVFNGGPTLRQTSKTKTQRPLTVVKPNFLCLQCDAITTSKNRLQHGEETKHRIYIESRSGAVYCQMCNDFVWDPTLEDLRTRRYGTGSFSPKKRKHAELFEDNDPTFTSTNTTEATCRVSGLRGIYNMGATCYMSVILQSFVHNPLLRNFYLAEGHQSSECEIKNCMSCAIDHMFQEFYASDPVVTTAFLASGILGSFFHSGRAAYSEFNSEHLQEQDAHEFFQYLTEELHEINGGSRSAYAGESPAKMIQMNHEKSCSCIIHQTFYGKLLSTKTCLNCKDVNTSVESFLDLSLGLEALSKKASLKTKFTLQQCLKKYFEPEGCEYTCHNCETLEAEKQLSIKSLPNVLCIQLKRFKQSDGTQSKVDTKVSFPLKLEMLPYTNRARTQDIKQNFELARSCTYDLQSVVVHVGSIDTGHYYSYSRVGNQWFRFNDHNINLATKSQVLNEQAFLLFYVIQSLS